MKKLFVFLFVLASFQSFSQFTDTTAAVNYIQDTIKDRRPNKVTAAQVQRAILGTLRLTTKRTDSLVRSLPVLSQVDFYDSAGTGTIKIRNTASMQDSLSRRWDSTQTQAYVTSQKDSFAFNANYIGGVGTTASPLYNKKADKADSIQVTEGGYVPLIFTRADTSLNVTYSGTVFKFKVKFSILYTSTSRRYQYIV